MEHPVPYQVKPAGRPAAQPRRLAAQALCMAQYAIPAGEVKPVEAVRRLASAAIGHSTLSPADALIVATDALLTPPDLDTAAALLEEAAVASLSGTVEPGGRGREGVITIRDLRPGRRVGLTRTGPALVVAEIHREGPLVTVTTTDGQQLSFAASGWLIDRTQG